MWRQVCSFRCVCCCLLLLSLLLLAVGCWLLVVVVVSAVVMAMVVLMVVVMVMVVMFVAVAIVAVDVWRRRRCCWCWYWSRFRRWWYCCRGYGFCTCASAHMPIYWTTVGLQQTARFMSFQRQRQRCKSRAGFFSLRECDIRAHGLKTSDSDDCGIGYAKQLGFPGYVGGVSKVGDARRCTTCMRGVRMVNLVLCFGMLFLDG